MLDPTPLCCTRLLRWSAYALALALAGLGAWWLGNILLGQNLHTVLAGRVYRSAQPTQAALESYIERYGIRTVVNLRGCGNPLPWYLAEGRAVQRHGVSLEDLSFSAIHLPAPGELHALVELLERAEYPLLLHCRHGADRTGLASAIVLLLQEDVPYAQARQELGLYYGHLSFGRTGMLDAFFSMYEAWLLESGQPHSAAMFRHWLLDEYHGGWCAGEVEQVEALGVAKAGRPSAFRARLHNRSDSVWQLKAMTAAGIHVYFHIWDARGNAIGEGRAGMLEATVAPGARYDVTLVLPPLPAGSYFLAVDLMEEYHCCFYQVGAAIWEGEFTVRE